MADLNQKFLNKIVTLRAAALTPNLDSTTQLMLDFPTERALVPTVADFNVIYYLNL